MSRWRDEDEYEPADWEDDPEVDGEYADELDEGPQDIDLEEFGDDDETEVVACHYCGREVYEDADRCPHCGRYITPGGEDSRSSLVWAALVGLILAALLMWLLR